MGETVMKETVMSFRLINLLDRLRYYNDYIVRFVNHLADGYLYRPEYIKSINWTHVSIPSTYHRHKYPCIMVYVTLSEGVDDNGKERLASGTLFVSPDGKLAWESCDYLSDFWAFADGETLNTKEKSKRIQNVIQDWYVYAKNCLLNELSGYRVDLY